MSTGRLAAALADRYRIERELGQGGMATVYLAHDLRHDRDVAIKVLHPDLGAALGGERFLSEIKTTAKLQHPHILPLLDSGDAGGGLLYYVMPLATGETLRARLERERQLPIEDAVLIAREVADALGYAHSFGVIHRDIKPENILLQGGHALVADFGIALAVQQAGGQRMTQTGLSLGTPQYMSPEQAMGERAVDARSDIYSLGAVAYEMLVGEPPFTGATVQTIVAKVMTERPAPISRVRDMVPPGVEAAVHKALAKLPADRYATAAAFASALAAPVTTTTGYLPSAGAAGLRRSRSLPIALTAGLLLGLGAGVALTSGRSAPEVVTGAITHVTIDDGLEIQPAISPDGKMMAYAAGTSLYVRLFLRPVGGGHAVPLTRDAPAAQQEPRWSPSGGSILFRANGGVDTVAAGLGGGTAGTLINGAQGVIATANWSPDGRRIVFVRGDSLMTYTIASGETRFVTKQTGKECSWSPRADFIACSDPRDYSAIGATMGNIGPSLITITAVSGGTPVAVTDSVSMNASPVWAPDGRRLYLISNRDGQRDIYYVRIGGDGRASGPLRRLTTALNAASLSLSSDGHRLAYSVYTPQANIWSLPVPPTGTATSAMATQVTFGHQLVESMEVTPDGKTLIYAVDRDGNSDIWRLVLGEREPEAMSSDVADEFGGVLSPDGRRLAFYSYPEGSGRGVIWVKPMDGGPVQRVNGSATYGLWPEWTPDGKMLTWPCNAAGTRGRCAATQDSAGRWQVEVKAELPSNWSPDGRWSANRRRNATTAADSVWIYAEGSGAGRLLYLRRSPSDPRATELQWGGDSRALFFRSSDSEGRAMFWRLSIDGSTPRLVGRLDDLTHPSYRNDFATDGRRIYFGVNDRQSDISVVELIER